ncbi:MAG: hypothetical protein JWR77_1353 [Rhizorhabdus sp.]|nr:hypothetical protein [Rhizorhabdus sp.]
MSAGKIRITDLADPVLSELQAGTVAYMNAHPVTLDPEIVLAKAREATGLSDFGADDFRERLDIWMQAADEDAELSQVGRAGIFGEAQRYAIARLYVEDLVRREPAILDVEIEKPLIIAGLPRSGTTYLLALLAADPRARSLPHWEAVRPVRAPYLRDGNDTRHDLCAAEWAQTDTLLPFVKSIHEFAPDHISEDIELQGVDFGGYYIEWLAMVPRWRDWQHGHDQSGVYRYMRKMMQVLSWQSGSTRWVTKCPQHMEQLQAVTSPFPGACTVINHRDPVASIQSAITGIAYSARITRTRVDMKAIADYWVDRYERLLRACVRERELLDPARSHDVYFHELMADPLGRIEQIYAKADLPFDTVATDAFQAAIEANKRGKHGQLVYDLRGDFGLEPEAIRERFGFYFDRFPVKIEVK